MEPFTYNDLDVLHDLAKILASPLDLRDQLEHGLNELCARTAMNRAMISILDRDSGIAILDVAHGVDIYNREIIYKPGEGITGQVAQTGKPLVITNLDKEKRFLDRTKSRLSLNRSEFVFFCVPVIHDDKVVGVLSADKEALDADNQEYELKFLCEVAELIANAVHMRVLEEENSMLKNVLEKNGQPSKELIGNSKVMKDVSDLIFQVSGSDTTALIHGETGTGKELVARAIHMNSPRVHNQFVEVNCAAIPDTLIESVLFGHEKGAFTGADKKKKGRFEEANSGTLFLDEIGELSLIAQAKLLKVIEQRNFQPLGSNTSVKVNVRIIAATNRDLEQDVAADKFRADLYYRLNVFPIYMPPLRERGGDMILLANYFVEKYSRKFRKHIHYISTPAIDLMLSYHWPGNVRELENCIERTVLLTRSDTIDSTDLPISMQKQTVNPEDNQHRRLESLIAAYERSIIVDAMKAARGNQSKAAQLLGTTKRIMQYKVGKYNIDRNLFRTPNPTVAHQLRFQKKVGPDN
jgi:Nif-specific regulatory protein